MSGYRRVTDGDARRLDPLLAAVTLDGSGLYWFRHRECGLPRGADVTDRALRQRIAFALRDRLYNSYYTKGAPSLTIRLDPPATPDLEFARHIGASVAGPAAPSRVALRYSPGFMMIRGGEPEAGSAATQVRLYWHVAAWDAADFAHLLTSILDRTGTGYALKMLNNPALYDRADSAVLYLSRNACLRIGSDLERAYQAFAGRLRADVPALTKRLGRGVGLAESPDATGTSYGLHRCALLADGLVRAWKVPHDDWPMRRRAIATVFAEHGLDTARPYLAPDGVDIFSPFVAPRAAPRPHPPGADALPALVGAIAGGAVWHGDACTWWRPGRAAPAGRRVAAPVGPDVYNGAAGMALFLAEYALARSCDEARRLAAGACRTVLADLAAGALADAGGLHVGAPGALLAAVHVARRLGLDRELRRANRLARAVARRSDARRSGNLDLLSGVAGDALALLSLGHLFADAPLLRAAAVRGRRLVDAAEWSGDAASWPSVDGPCTANLTGMAHGAAGIASALAALYAETGEDAFRQVALAGFRYERAAFDPALGNWPDFRMIYRTRRTERRLRRTNTAWCHGPGGIALARIQALSVLDDPALANDARRALAILRDWLRASTDAPHADLCLCHGLAGNAAILAIAGAASLGAPGDDALLRQAADTLETRLAGLRDARAIDDPGLMTGMSGIGWYLLTWRDPPTLGLPFLPVAPGAEEPPVKPAAAPASAS